mmetsp:Transcript_5242/g.14771  ORF Transcript_5242/g.14771 Transcript_5242/m.14771 type:complete len:108 (+) Transcript_5242:253-576(+)|eukprot:CAMPEP_0119133780 /NCGR_PEP_ID=MMETSP1310-20130426/13553_1 /TAXON_ID=464262 /ORGANISM="Genus nov. species nov., Strain RCC2339" /LENGTH=107 /DNA_ID=CAMNT_0007124483 /DNA_START=226 /DNA_END=549 /DNA_ORIENTATION=+
MVMLYLAGLVAAAGLARAGLVAYQKNLISLPRVAGRKYVQGGFQDVMNKAEAARILGVRQTSSADKIIAAHRKIMMLNHPDLGGSPYLATKINEAKDLLVGKENKRK